MQRIISQNPEYHKTFKKKLEESSMIKMQLSQKETNYLIPLHMINYKETIYKYNRKLDMYRVGEIEEFLENQYKNNKQLFNNAWTIVFSHLDNVYHCIDGQHRLYAFTRLAKSLPELKDHRILVMIRECEDEDEEDNFFMQLAKAEEIPSYLKEGSRPVRDLASYILEQVYDKIEYKENVLSHHDRCKVPNIREIILKEKIVELYNYLKKIQRFNNIDDKKEIINIVSDMINDFNRSLLGKYNSSDGFKELIRLFGKYSPRSLENCYKKKSFISIPVFWDYFYRD